MNKKPQFFILVNLALPVREYSGPTLKNRAREIKEKYNYQFQTLKKSA